MLMEHEQTPSEEPITEELAHSIGMFIALSEMHIQMNMHITTCLSDDSRSYRIIGKPKLHHATADAIIDNCKQMFGHSRMQMHMLLSEIRRELEVFETCHEVHRSGKYVGHVLRGIARTLRELMRTRTLVVHSMELDRKTVRRIAVYRTLETLVRTAIVELFEPARIQQVLSDHASRHEPAKHSTQASATSRMSGT